ncbi:MAG: putative 4-mercaptohistidine N1-methyltransferase [Luteolibacter sp.]
MSAIYETEKLVSEYLFFHYGSPEEILPPDRPWPVGMQDALDFPCRTPRHFSSHTAKRGLDLGCAVGRSTFEMARACEEVIGIDFSHAFIRTAETLRTGGGIPYSRLEEAAIRTPLIAKAPGGINVSSIRFQQGDAMNLPESIGTFDRVHAANLLCRLPEPLRLLKRLPSLINPGGELVLATPCTWLEEFTPPTNWPETTTLDWLKQHLSPHFQLLREAAEPFLIRETARKFQWTTSLVTVWKRRSAGVPTGTI